MMRSLQHFICKESPGAHILSPSSLTDWELAQQHISTWVQNDLRKICLIHPMLDTFSYINDKRNYVARVTEDCSQAGKIRYL